MPAEGQPDTELVVRTASVVGNYDYLIDYRFPQNGDMQINIGSTGQDAVKGVASTSMEDSTAAADTAHGTLVAPNLVAPFHDHYFNFRLDFDVDGPVNHPAVLEIVPGEPAPDSPRRSFWTVERSAPASELEARYTLSAMAPKYFLVANEAERTQLGHHPAYMIHHGSVAYGPFDYAADPPMKRNAYIGAHDMEHRPRSGPALCRRRVPDAERRLGYAGRVGQGGPAATGRGRGDVVHGRVPSPPAGREDWPVMSTDWKTIHIMTAQLLHPEPRADDPSAELRASRSGWRFASLCRSDGRGPAGRVETASPSPTSVPAPRPAFPLSWRSGEARTLEPKRSPRDVDERGSRTRKRATMVGCRGAAGRRRRRDGRRHGCRLRFVGTPRVGMATSAYGRDYRVGNTLGVLDQSVPASSSASTRTGARARCWAGPTTAYSPEPAWVGRQPAPAIGRQVSHRSALHQTAKRRHTIRAASGTR